MAWLKVTGVVFEGVFEPRPSDFGATSLSIVPHCLPSNMKRSDPNQVSRSFQVLTGRDHEFPKVSNTSRVQTWAFHSIGCTSFDKLRHLVSRVHYGICVSSHLKRCGFKSCLLHEVALWPWAKSLNPTALCSSFLGKCSSTIRGEDSLNWGNGNNLVPWKGIVSVNKEPGFKSHVQGLVCMRPWENHLIDFSLLAFKTRGLSYMALETHLILELW